MRNTKFWYLEINPLQHMCQVVLVKETKCVWKQLKTLMASLCEKIAGIRKCIFLIPAFSKFNFCNLLHQKSLNAEASSCNRELSNYAFNV
jgi:hypothetical protein